MVLLRLQYLFPFSILTKHLSSARPDNHNPTANLTLGYLDVLYCNEEQTEELHRAWDEAENYLINAQLDLLHPIADIFMQHTLSTFKDLLLQYLHKAADQDDLPAPTPESREFKRPRVACGNQESIHRLFPRITADEVERCFSPTQPPRFLASKYDGAVVLCDDKFFRTPVLPARKTCPTVRANVFQRDGGFALSQAGLLMLAMTMLYVWPMQKVPVGIASYQFMNQAVATRKNPSAVNIGTFLYFSANECTQVVNPNLPPWAPADTAQVNSITIQGDDNQSEADWDDRGKPEDTGEGGDSEGQNVSPVDVA